MIVTAYCPGHISGYFRRVVNQSRTATGSVGAGIVIDPGVTARVMPSDRTSVRVFRRTVQGNLQQVADHAPPVAAALSRIGMDASVVTECSLPIGAGFGLSAAALLATLTAANRAGDLGFGMHEIARIAHETEVRYRTGLGDVAACQDGGRVLRNGAGIDGEIRRFSDMDGPLCAVSFGPIHTPTVLGSAEQMEQVARAFPAATLPTKSGFFASCNEFSKNSGLETPEVKKVLCACRAEGIPAAMTMLGNGVFSYGSRAGAVLRPFGRTYPCSMARAGARILGVDP